MSFTHTTRYTVYTVSTGSVAVAVAIAAIVLHTPTQQSYTLMFNLQKNGWYTSYQMPVSIANDTFVELLSQKDNF